MKKILFALLTILMMCSCIRSQESSSVRHVKIVNSTEFELTFSDIDNGGDPRFYPQSSFTLKPREEYSQSQNNINPKESVVYCPISMTLECNGKSIHFTRESDITKNPCNMQNWYHLDNFSVYGPGIHFDFEIFDEDLETWFGKM